jgi:hypothetical protein
MKNGKLLELRPSFKENNDRENYRDNLHNDNPQLKKRLRQKTILSSDINDFRIPVNSKPKREHSPTIWRGEIISNLNSTNNLDDHEQFLDINKEYTAEDKDTFSDYVLGKFRRFVYSTFFICSIVFFSVVVYELTDPQRRAIVSESIYRMFPRTSNWVSSLLVSNDLTEFEAPPPTVEELESLLESIGASSLPNETSVANTNISMDSEPYAFPVEEEKVIEIKPVVAIKKSQPTVVKPISQLEANIRDILKSVKMDNNLKQILPATIIAESKKNNLDPYLVLAVIKNESSFRPEAISYKGARGLMQLMPNTKKYIEVKIANINPEDQFSSFDAEYNIKLGSAYLRYLRERYKGRITLALMAYNWGPGRVDDMARGIRSTPSEVMMYVLKIIDDLHRWHASS